MHIGYLDGDYDPYTGATRVRFTDLATQRVTEVPNDSTDPVISVAGDGLSFVSGHMYRVEVVDTYGMPLPFQVYEWDTATASRDLTADSYSYVTVRFIRIFDGAGDVLTYSEQWFTLPV